MTSMEKVLRLNLKITPKLTHTVLGMWVFCKKAALRHLNIEIFDNVLEIQLLKNQNIGRMH